MICAPRQTILLCVAALTLNAAASELGTASEKTFDRDFSGEFPYALKNGGLLLQSIPGESFFHLFDLAVENSPGLRAASEKLQKKDYAGFAEVVRQTAADPKDPGNTAAQLLMADQAFYKKEYFRASSLYLAICKKDSLERPLALRALMGALGALINAGAEKDALALLMEAAADFPEQQELWNKLEIFLLGRTGDFLELAKRWALFKENFPHAPEALIFEGLFSGGNAAIAANLPQSAAGFFADAFNFAVDNAGRKNCLKKIILLQEKKSPEQALRSIERYLLFFPRSADAGMIRLKKGELLTGLKDYPRALACYREVLNGKNFKIEERLQAASRAALLSEENGDISMAREFYNSAIRRFAAFPESANIVKMQLLEFLIRTKEYSPAAVLGDELAGVSGVDQKRLNIFRIRALSELKRYAEAARIASRLADSEDQEGAVEGAWHLAQLMELQNKNKEARQLYLNFAERFPKDRRVPDALLAAVDFSIKEKDFKAAAQKLDEYLQKFPDHAGVRKGMFVAVFSLLHHDAPGNREKAEEIFRKMTVLFPGSDDSDAAALELVRYLSKKDEHASALKLLEDFRKKRSSSPLLPEILVIGGEIFEKMGSLKKAVEYVDLLLDRYPNSPWSVEAAMLGGRCCFQSGNYQRALKYYERACELGGRGVMAQVAAGEAADCHLQLRKKENLDAAIRIYRDLAARSEFPALKIQALYKLGIAYEFSGNGMKALDAYEELLSLTVRSQKIRQSSGVALWCGRAARGALRIILGNSHLPDGSQRAQRIYRLYSLLELPGSEGELRRYLEEIRKHYNLLD